MATEKDTIELKRVRTVLEATVCLWCSEIIAEHTGEELKGCYEALLLTKEGTIIISNKLWLHNETNNSNG